jgi:hypothetical protein
MKLASSIFDHPLVLLLIIGASLVRWLWQKSQGEKQGSEEPERPVVPDQSIPRGGETSSEEERIRRFLEALGRPPGSAPPPKVTVKRRIEPKVFSPLPPLTTAPPPLPPPLRQPVMEPSEVPAMPKRIFTPTLVQEQGFEVEDIDQQISPVSTRGGQRFVTDRGGLGVQLASPQGLRNAIVLREIFGPPRSLQPIDLTSF